MLYLRSFFASSHIFHYHKSVSELYVVQSGWIVYAEKSAGELKLRILQTGESVVFQPLVPHNIFLSSRSVIPIKYGSSTEEKDWFASPELDTATESLNPYAIFLVED